MIEIKKLEKKEVLTYEELENIFMGYLNNKLNDEEMTKVLKLICKNGLTDNEIYDLTDIFIKSGECYPKNSSFIDKHSTGGVGDTTTLVVLPILAALNVKVSKMSGKSLGHTGGTIDKLESIGVKTNLTKKEFYDTIGKHNMVIASSSTDLCPLDKKVYSLRDVTGTVKSIPLIAVSIMSKKIAAGAGKILIDIKVGKGALLENIKEAETLASLMIKIGENYCREVVCVLTRMDDPIGYMVGNKLEVMEAFDILSGKESNSLLDLSIQISSIMYSMSRNTSIDSGYVKSLEVIKSLKAYNIFKNYIEDLGGKMPEKSDEYEEVLSLKNGYVKGINSKIIGELSMQLGAGRKTKNSKINYDAGIEIVKNIKDKVKKGDVLARCYGKKIESNEVYEAFTFSKFKPKKKSIVIKIIK